MDKIVHHVTITTTYPLPICNAPAGPYFTLNVIPAAGILLPLNTWNHIVVTWTSRRGTVRFYVNGELIHVETQSKNAGSQVSSGGIIVLGQVF